MQSRGLRFEIGLRVAERAVDIHDAALHFQRARTGVEDTHHREAHVAVGDRRLPRLDRVNERLALAAQRLGHAQRGDHDVTRTHTNALFVRERAWWRRYAFVEEDELLIRR